MFISSMIQEGEVRFFAEGEVAPWWVVVLYPSLKADRWFWRWLKPWTWGVRFPCDVLVSIEPNIARVTVSQVGPAISPDLFDYNGDMSGMTFRGGTTGRAATGDKPLTYWSLWPSWYADFRDKANWTLTFEDEK